MSSSGNPFPLSPRCGSKLRYARYVGRVGALAVSLGVGFAIASTPGVALADDTTNATATSTSPSADPPRTTAEQRQSRAAERRRAVRVFSGNVDRPSRHTRVDRSTSSAPEGDSNPADKDAVGSGAGAVDGTVNNNATLDRGNGGGSVVGSGTPVGNVRGTTVKRSSIDAVKQSVSIRRVLPSRPTERSGAVTTSAPTAGTSTGQKTIDTTSVQLSATAGSAVAANQPQTTRFAKVFSLQSTPTPTTPTPTLTTRAAATPVTLVSGFLAAVGLAPSLTSPTTPAPAPVGFVWAALAFVRRELGQLQQTYLNRSPRANGDIVPASEDTSVTFNPLGNDVDPDSRDTLTVKSYTQPTNGTVVQNANGTFTYTPNANFNGTDNFNYTVTDETSPAHIHGLLGLLTGGGHTSTATVTINVAAVNDAPVATGATVSVNQDSVLTGTLAASDVDGDSLTYSLAGTGVAHGTVVITNPTTGAYTYTPTAGYNGPDQFTFVAKDASATSNAATVKITVNPAADAPSANLSVGTANSQTGAVSVTFSYSDSASDRLTATAPTPQLGQLTPRFGSVATDGTTQSLSTTYTYVPSPEARLAAANGTGPTTETLTFSVTDGRSTSTRTIDVPISAARTPTTIAVGPADDASGDVPITLTILQNASDPSPSVTLPDAQFGDVVLKTTTVMTDDVTTRQVLTYVYTPGDQARVDANNGTGPLSEDLTFTVAGGQPSTLTVTAPIDPAEAAVTETVSVGSTPTDVSVSPNGGWGIITKQ